MERFEETPDTENVVYIDEYPHLSEKIRLRRLGGPAVKVCNLLVLPTPINSSDYLGKA